MKIIVSGSLGNVSKPLTMLLLEQGHAVTVISSNREKQMDIEALGAVAAIGSLDNAEFLITTFTGADVVYAMVPPNFTAADPIVHYQTIGRSYAQAIRLSGIKHVVNLSSWGAHLQKGTGIIAGSYQVEKILNELRGVSVTHLRPTSFYNNLYHYTGMIRQAGFIGTNYGGEDRLTMVAPQDIADVAAEELVSQTIGGKIRYVASDEHTCNEIAAILGNAIGRPDLKWITFTDDQVQETMEKNGFPPAMAAKLVELNASIHSGALRADYDQHKPAVMGKVKLQDFAKGFANAFKQS